MSIDSIRDQAAICGVGMTELSSFPERSTLDLATEAFKKALDDAGLEKTQVDGLVCLQYGTDYDRFLEATGLDVRYTYQGWNHGRFTPAIFQIAAMAIYHEMADTIAIVYGKRQKAFGTVADNEAWRQGLGPHGESPPYGALLPAYGVALSAQRYFHLYGGGNPDLAPIAVTFRENARLRPGAVRTDPLTIEDHQASRWVLEPLRLLDCCQINEGGAALIMTRADRAKDMKKPPVYLMGMQGLRAGPEYHNFGHVGLGVAQQSVFTYKPTADDLAVYRSAGIDRSDVGALTAYDAFSPLVLYTLERFGFCGPGEAMEFVKDGNIGLKGSLPINTSGGLLSEGHLSGFNLFIELVRQLRHECGDRQVTDLEIAQYASFLGDSLIFRR